MPIIDDYHGRRQADAEQPDAFEVEQDLLAMPSLPWQAIITTFFAVVLCFGIAHTILLATKEKNKLIGMTLALRDKQAQAQQATVAVAREVGKAVLVPAGPFWLGRPEDDEETNSDATPMQQVHLPAFYIGKYEVTNDQYATFIDEVGYIPPPNWRGELTYPKGTGPLPVTYVSSSQAGDYAEWAGGRLCTEQEWEKAARGTDTRVYPYGDDYDPDRANIDYLVEHLTAVGSFPNGVSPYGVHDMMGNVYEWTSSRYGPYPGNQDDPSQYATFVVDSQGNISFDPDEASYYVVTRGGCWKCDPWSSQVTTRNPTRPDFASDFFGFRMCWDAAANAPVGDTP